MKETTLLFAFIIANALCLAQSGMHNTSKTTAAGANKNLPTTLNSQQNNSTPTATEIKATERKLLTGQNDTIQANYLRFNAYLDSGICYREDWKAIQAKKPILPSAYYYYLQIPQNTECAPLQEMMKNKLCSAIEQKIDKAIQQNTSIFYPKDLLELLAISKLLRDFAGDPKLIESNFLSKCLYIDCIHYGDIESMDSGNKNETIAEMKKISAYVFDTLRLEDVAVVHKMDSAISFDSGAAYLFQKRSLAYRKMNRFKEAISDLQKAQTLSPMWADLFVDELTLSGKMNDTIGIIRACKKLFAFHYNDALSTLAGVFNERGMADSANYYINYVLQDSGWNKKWILQNIGANYYYYYLHNYSLAVDFLIKADELKSTGEWRDFITIACCYFHLNEPAKGYHYLELHLEDIAKSVDSDFNYIGTVTENDCFNRYRSAPEFIALTKKYFP